MWRLKCPRNLRIHSSFLNDIVPPFPELSIFTDKYFISWVSFGVEIRSTTRKIRLFKANKWFSMQKVKIITFKGRKMRNSTKNGLFWPFFTSIKTEKAIFLRNGSMEYFFLDDSLPSRSQGLRNCAWFAWKFFLRCAIARQLAVITM